MEKFLIIIIIVLILYYLFKCWNMKVEHFADTPKEQSISGSDDTNSINTLAKIATQLMNGGLTIPGDITVTKNITTDSIKIKNKWMIGGTGGASGNDDWMRITDIDNKDYKGGLAAGRLYTADNTINGRNLFAEIDDLKNKLVESYKSVPVIINFNYNDNDHSIIDRTFVIPNKVYGQVSWWDRNAAPIRDRIAKLITSLGFDGKSSSRDPGGSNFTSYQNITLSVPIGKIVKIYGWQGEFKKFGSGYYQETLSFRPHFFWVATDEFADKLPDKLNLSTSEGLP